MACFSVADKNKPEQSGLCSDEAEDCGIVWGRRAAVSRSSQKVGSDGAPPCGRLQPYRRAERDFLRKRRSKGAGGWLVFLSQTKTSRSKADFAPTRRRGWDSPRRPRAACLPDCAAPGHRSPGRGDAALRPPLFRPSNPFLLNSKAGRPCVARAPCFGGEGGILREGLGLLVFQTALLRAIAPRGGGTPHCGLPSSALRIPSFSTAKQDARALHGRPALAERVGFEPTCRCRQTDFESAPL